LSAYFMILHYTLASLNTCFLRSRFHAVLMKRDSTLFKWESMLLKREFVLLQCEFVLLQWEYGLPKSDSARVRKDSARVRKVSVGERKDSALITFLLLHTRRLLKPIESCSNLVIFI